MDDTTISTWLKEHPTWELDNRSIQREFVFPSFVEAFGFMTSVAIVAERMNHHPDWSNTYNRVVVSLTTHDKGGITELDLQLAEAAERLAGSVP